MQILRVCSEYFPSIGGADHHVKDMSERLAEGHEVTVFACDPSGKLPKEENINGFSVKRFRRFSPGDAYHISFGMGRELKKGNFDIVREHSYHVLAIAERLIEIYAQHKSGKPLIYSLPQNTWDEVARRYEQVVGKVCR